jgi:hypothetical protein
MENIQPETNAPDATVKATRSSYIIGQRLAADVAGTPLLRSATPVVVSPGVASSGPFTKVIANARPMSAHPDELKSLVIVSIEGENLVVHDTSSGTTDRVTFALMDLLCETVQVPSGRVSKNGNGKLVPARRSIIMFSDHQALRAMMKLAKKNPNNQTTRLDRIMDVSSSLPMSQLFPVLTKALALRYYMPASLDTNLIGDWITAFHLDGLPLRDALTALAFQTVRTSQVTADRSPDSRLLELARSETFLTKSAAYSNTLSGVRAFRAITGITETWAHYRELDPKMLQENIDGEAVFAGSLLAAGGARGSVLIRMDSAPKLKAGEEVIALDGEGNQLRGNVKIDSIRLDIDRIIVKIVKEIDRSSGRIILVKKPFVGATRDPFASPWASGKFSPTEGMIERNISVQIPHRSMPLDVLIAGQH